MLSVRAKPPSERDFVDVFQKFKLSFNLLARLKSHIHDPNAPELVHFLFTPLALIVDASHDSHYTPNLASKIVSPLLSADAVDLLENCLTSKESELWNMLGEAWIVPDGDWKGPVQPYQPVFSNNWAPKLMFLEKMTGGHGLDEVKSETIFKSFSLHSLPFWGPQYVDVDSCRLPSVYWIKYHNTLPFQIFKFNFRQDP